MSRSEILVWFLGLCGWTLLVGGTEARAGDPRLDKVLADWQKRQNRFQTVEYRVEGEHAIPKGAYSVLSRALSGEGPNGHPIPAEELTAPASFTILLDFARGRHRLQSREVAFNLDSGNLATQVRTCVYDGTFWKNLVPKNENSAMAPGTPEMGVVSGNLKNQQFETMIFPIFFGHGRLYILEEGILPGKLRLHQDPNYLYIHGNGVQDGCPCLILRTQVLQLGNRRFDEYWVDTARDSAILRYLAYSDDQPITAIAIQYRELHEGWWPESWHWTEFDRGKTLYFERMRVMKRRLDPPVSDGDFEMNAKPGMTVEVVTNRAIKNPLEMPAFEVSVYRIDDNGEKVAIPDPYHRQEDRYSQQFRTKHWLWLLLPLAVILALFGWTRWRRKRGFGIR
jgi:hypothetical protein